MLREFLTDYKDGLFSSLQGFILLHKLDRPEGQQVNETRRTLSDCITKRTVLENRRKHTDVFESTVETQKESQQKVSTVYRVLSLKQDELKKILYTCGQNYVTS